MALSAQHHHCVVPMLCLMFRAMPKHRQPLSCGCQRWDPSITSTKAWSWPISWRNWCHGLQTRSPVTQTDDWRNCCDVRCQSRPLFGPLFNSSPLQTSIANDLKKDGLTNSMEIYVSMLSSTPVFPESAGKSTGKPCICWIHCSRTLPNWYPPAT